MNNLHIITLYELHIKFASRARRVERVEPVELDVSSVWSRAVKQSQHSQNAWAWYVERVESCRVEAWQAKWNLGFSAKHRQQSLQNVGSEPYLPLCSGREVLWLEVLLYSLEPRYTRTSQWYRAVLLLLLKNFLTVVIFVCKFSKIYVFRCLCSVLWRFHYF